MPEPTRDPLEVQLIETARDIADKLSELGPGNPNYRRALVDNLREVATAYGELRANGPYAHRFAGSERLEFELHSDLIFRLGHGDGWVVLNLYHHDRPITTASGDPGQIFELARGLISQARAAQKISGDPLDLFTDAASFTETAEDTSSPAE